jgi:hypothetical protein
MILPTWFKEIQAIQDKLDSERDTISKIESNAGQGGEGDTEKVGKYI